MIKSRRLFYALLAALAVGSVGAGVSGTHAASSASPKPAILVFTGDLTASQVVAGSNSTATGSATIQINTVSKLLTTDLAWSGLSGPADRSHVHSGPEGSPTDDVFFHEVINDEDRTVIPCPSNYSQDYENCVPETGSIHNELDVGDGYGFPSFDDLVASAVTDGLFIDMHTQKYPSGEIRAQLMPAAYQPPVGFLWPAANSKWLAGIAIPLRFTLTDVNGVRISDALAAQLLSPACKVQVYAVGVQTLPATCVRYDAASHQFTYNWKLGTTPGAETISILVSYPNTGVITSESVTLLKAPPRR
jgi:hypothetical protein